MFSGFATQNKIISVKEKSKLRQKPNEKKVWEIYKKIICSFLLKSERFLNYNIINEIEI